jgi:adenine-specific DNA-methyltransferase
MNPMTENKMQKLDATSVEAQSADLMTANIEQLNGLFPELITEGPNGLLVNVDRLKNLVGDSTATETEEKYGLNWHGKRQARKLALTPSTGTLRPCPDESVNWDATQNLFIEGDNLEVLKLLQKSYGGKVKLIYIDPPYNTGKDFVYPDNFQDNIKNYLELTGQLEGGKKISSNVEESGRFHTDWLNMIWPRIRLGRNLLADDGLMCISINDKEMHNLRLVCDEIFGEENFVECYIWNSTFRPDNSSKIFRKNAEFIICYAKRIETVKELLGEVIERTGLPSLTKSSMAKSTIEFPAQKITFTLRDGTYSKGARDSYELLDNVQVLGGTNVGSFRLTGNMTWGQDNLLSELAQGTKIIIKTDGFVPYVDKGSEGTLRPSKIISNEKVGDVLAANAEVRELMGDDVFNYPKPVSLLQHIIGFRRNHDLVMDFFAGSGSTAHAVLAANAVDNGQRKYILVQLPEPLDPEAKEHMTAAKFCKKLGRPLTIAELTKERVRRAGKKLGGGSLGSKLDVGFRVFKLDRSNICEWNPKPDDLEKSLFDQQDHLLDGRTESDILYELLLKLGLDLCVPIACRSVDGKELYSVGGGALMGCLADDIPAAQVEILANELVAWRKDLSPASETTCVFRDGAFSDDVAKTNMAAILEQNGILTVRSL